MATAGLFFSENEIIHRIIAPAPMEYFKMMYGDAD